MWNLGLYCISSNTVVSKWTELHHSCFVQQVWTMYSSQKPVTSFTHGLSPLQWSDLWSWQCNIAFYRWTHWYLIWSDICIMLPSLLCLKVFVPWRWSSWYLFLPVSAMLLTFKSVSKNTFPFFTVLCLLPVSFKLGVSMGCGIIVSEKAGAVHGSLWENVQRHCSLLLHVLSLTIIASVCSEMRLICTCFLLLLSF